MSIFQIKGQDNTQDIRRIRSYSNNILPESAAPLVKTQFQNYRNDTLQPSLPSKFEQNQQIQYNGAIASTDFIFPCRQNSQCNYMNFNVKQNNLLKNCDSNSNAPPVEEEGFWTAILGCFSKSNVVSEELYEAQVNQKLTYQTGNRLSFQRNRINRRSDKENNPQLNQLQNGNSFQNTSQSNFNSNFNPVKFSFQQQSQSQTQTSKTQTQQQQQFQQTQLMQNQINSNVHAGSSSQSQSQTQIQEMCQRLGTNEEGLKFYHQRALRGDKKFRQVLQSAQLVMNMANNTNAYKSGIDYNSAEFNNLDSNYKAQGGEVEKADKNDKNDKNCKDFALQENQNIINADLLKETQIHNKQQQVKNREGSNFQVNFSDIVRNEEVRSYLKGIGQRLKIGNNI